MDLSFYKEKVVLITGHTGFKGSWLSKILIMAGAKVVGYSLKAPTNPSLFELSKVENQMVSIIGDIRDFDHLKEVFYKYKPELVFHLAAQPIVRESYFKINVENYSPSQYVFALKYPEKEDFVEELEGGETNNHEDEFHAFFNQLENYIQQVCDAFRDYSLDHNQRTLVENYVDLDSLAEYAVVDQTFRESDHSQKSFKMYRIAGELLKFGPNWDYDSCCFGLPYLGTYVSNPFSVGRLNDPLYFGEGWGRILYNDTSYGRQLLKEVWLNITDEMISNYQNNLMQEYERISSYLLSDCSLWVNNQLYVVFDNLRYSKVFVTTAISYLRNYYISI